MGVLDLWNGGEVIEVERVRGEGLGTMVVIEEIWAGRGGKSEGSGDGRSVPERVPAGAGEDQSGWEREKLAKLESMTPKELGELAEAEFLREVLSQGMAVAKPWGESRGYDFIVDDEGKLTRVQVKAAFRQGRQGGYSLRTYRSSKQCYTKKHIDALAGYVAPLRAWYLFPVGVVEKVRSLKLFPQSEGRRSKFEKWREAWRVVKKMVRFRRGGKRRG